MTVRSWLASRFAPRAAGLVPASQPQWLIRHPTLQEAGVPITAETSVQVSAVYGCCRLIVDCLASAPIHVTEVKAKGVRETLHDDPVAYTLNYGAPIAQAPDAPTSQAIEESLLWGALIHGNGYAEIQRDLAGKVFALWPIEPDRVQSWRDETGFYYRIYHASTFAPVNGSFDRLEAADMFHVRGPSLYGWVGDSAVYRAAKAIGIAQAAQVYAAAYFANGTVLSGVLTSDKNITQPQADAAKAEWTERHGGGPGKQHGITVMGQGLKFEQINHNAQESQLVEARRFQVAEIARFFGVPTTLLADNEAWTNLSELYLGFYRSALRPWAERFDAEATRKLFPHRHPWREVAHDLTHLTLGSFKDQVAALAQATGSKPILTQNEARAIVGKNSEPGGDSLEPVKAAAPPTPDRPAPDEEKPEPPPVRKPTPGKPPVSARDAVVAMFADAFGRHVRRVANRRADIKRELTDAERASFRARLVEDCASALALAKRGASGDAGTVSLETFADALDAGEPPEKAAERFVGGIWTEAA